MWFRKGVSTLKTYYCYSAGPGLFPRDLLDGGRETWEEAQKRVVELNSKIAAVPEFEVITPSNDELTLWDEVLQPRACLYKDLLHAVGSDIVFAGVTPLGGREPDSGTIVEATACALSGALLVLWMDPLTTLAERYADAEVHPESGSKLNVHHNLMVEQLYRWSWEKHFGCSYPVFGSLDDAVRTTAGPTPMSQNTAERALPQFSCELHCKQKSYGYPVAFPLQLRKECVIL